MLQKYPIAADFPSDANAERELGVIKAMILGPRQIRGQLDVPQSRKVPAYVKAADDAAWAVIERNSTLIQATANLESLTRVMDEAQLPPTALQIVDGHSIYAPLKSLIDDVDAELSRIEKRRLKVEKDIAANAAKLANANFLANARADVVEEHRTRIANLQTEIEQLAEQAKRVASLQ
jgi:valyl-tRNA synthetase